MTVGDCRWPLYWCVFSSPEYAPCALRTYYYGDSLSLLIMILWLSYICIFPLCELLMFGVHCAPVTPPQKATYSGHITLHISADGELVCFVAMNARESNRQGHFVRKRKGPVTISSKVPDQKVKYKLHQSSSCILNDVGKMDANMQPLRAYPYYTHNKNRKKS